MANVGLKVCFFKKLWGNAFLEAECLSKVDGDIVVYVVQDGASGESIVSQTVQSIIDTRGREGKGRGRGHKGRETWKIVRYS